MNPSMTRLFVYATILYVVVLVVHGVGFVFEVAVEVGCAGGEVQESDW